MNIDGQNMQRSINTYLKQLSMIYKSNEQESHTITILPYSNSKYPYHTLNHINPIAILGGGFTPTNSILNFTNLVDTSKVKFNQNA